MNLFSSALGGIALCVYAAVLVLMILTALLDRLLSGPEIDLNNEAAGAP
jgi:hypothetical protein